MDTLNDFVAYYHKNGKTPNQMGYPKNPLNIKQLKSLFVKYRQSLLKKENVKKRQIENKQKKIKSQIENPSVDLKWAEVRKAAFKRDHYKCQLMYFLPDEYVELRNHLQGLDPCHVFGRGAYPHMKYDLDNIVSLHRLFHSRLDEYRHPFTGDSISHKEIYEWWKKIVGAKRYHDLLKRSEQRRSK